MPHVKSNPTGAIPQDKNRTIKRLKPHVKSNSIGDPLAGFIDETSKALMKGCLDIFIILEIIYLLSKDVIFITGKGRANVIYASIFM